jgi:hypothetical protein
MYVEPVLVPKLWFGKYIFSTKKLCINFDQKWVGLHTNILGKIFTNSFSNPEFKTSFAYIHRSGLNSYLARINFFRQLITELNRDRVHAGKWLGDDL